MLSGSAHSKFEQNLQSGLEPFRVLIQPFSRDMFMKVIVEENGVKDDDNNI